MIKTSTIIKVSARIGSMVELVKQIGEIKIHCAGFRRHEIKVDSEGVVLVDEKAYARQKSFFLATE